MQASTRAAIRLSALRESIDEQIQALRSIIAGEAPLTALPDAIGRLNSSLSNFTHTSETLQQLMSCSGARSKGRGRSDPFLILAHCGVDIGSDPLADLRQFSNSVVRSALGVREQAAELIVAGLDSRREPPTSDRDSLLAEMKGDEQSSQPPKSRVADRAMRINLN